MKIIQVIILGIIQGIAEFLPISSSAHLIIFRDVFGIGKGMGSELALCFDLALHLGTLLAIAVFFFKDFLNMVVKGFTKGVKDKEGKLFFEIIVATIPAAIAGVLFEDVIENAIRTNYYLIAIALIVMGILLYWVDKNSKSIVKYEKITLKQSILIGISQALAAAFPGVSRSGITMTVARWLKIDRESAAKFSFLLAAPITLAAVLVDLSSFTFDMAFFMGVLASFVVGLFVIKFLLEYLKKGSFKIFAIYRILFGLLVFGCIIFR